MANIAIIKSRMLAKKMDYWTDDFFLPNYKARWTPDGRSTWFYSKTYPNRFVRLMQKMMGIEWEEIN